MLDRLSIDTRVQALVNLDYKVHMVNVIDFGPERRVETQVVPLADFWEGNRDCILENDLQRDLEIMLDGGLMELKGGVGDT